MSAIDDGDIPYEGQQEARACGAAALCMVYRSFGLAATQSEIWQRLARPGPGGVPRANTWRLCADALRQGLAALTFQARTSWEVLQLCTNPALRVILNHRLASASPAGHYTVLLRADGESATVHDPQFGPARRLSRADLLALWRRDAWGCEITGNVLVALARTPPGVFPCARCGSPGPGSVLCPGCREPIPLQPGLVLGCVATDCPARTWERIFCPSCDVGVSNVERWF